MGVQIPPSALHSIGEWRVKEIKPRLIFTDRKERSRAGSTRNLLIILLTFCVGVYVGIKLSDMDLIIDAQKGLHKEQTAMLGDRTAEQAGGEEDMIEEEKISDRQSSPSDAGQSVADTYSEQPGTTTLDEVQLYENNSQEHANLEQGPVIDKKDGFTVQIGAFKEIERANKAVNELNIRGYEPYILPYVNSLGTNWYLVRIGKFRTREEAKKYATSFQTTEGMEAIVERIE
jgi:cell division septation protein DedD